MLLLFAEQTFAIKHAKNITSRQSRLMLPGNGAVSVRVENAPAANLSIPIIGINGAAANQQRQVNWDTTWKLSDLPPGKYLVTGVPVEAAGVRYSVTPISVDVVADATVNVTFAYKSETIPTTGQVTVTLENAPNAQVPVTFTGAKDTIVQSVTNGQELTLPIDTYQVSSEIENYTTTITPNPITVPTQTSLKITYTQVQPGPCGTVKVTLVNPPTSTVPLTFAGTGRTVHQTVGNNAMVTLSADTYNVSSNVVNTNPTITPNPITVPNQTALTVNYGSTPPPPTEPGFRTLSFRNQCPFPVWFGTISAVVNARGKSTPVCNVDADCHDGSGCVDRGGGVKHCFWKNPIPADGNFRLAPNGGTNSVKLPIYNNGERMIWSGAAAGRTNCTASGCETADCDGGTGACLPGRGFTQPATQAEFTFDKAGADFYNIGVINGMNLPVAMAALNPPSGSDPYRCGSPGSNIARNQIAGCSWNMSPPSNDYVWVKAGGAACTSDASCTAPQRCGLSFNPGQSPAVRKTCGKHLGYWTANQICGVQSSYGAPFNCQQALRAPQDDLRIHNLYACTKLGSCYSDGATSRCCGCTNWDGIGIPVPGPQWTKQCVSTNPDWKPNVEGKLAWLKRACPSVYTYPYDDMSSTFVCQVMKDQNGTTVNSVDYQITFCPGGATGGVGG